MNHIDLFKSSFPEDLYIPATTYESDYVQRVFFGINLASSLNVTIGLMARDVGEIIDYTVLRVRRLSEYFKCTNVVWLENSSQDDTRYKIQDSFSNHNTSNSSVLIGNRKLDPHFVENRNIVREIDKLPFQTDKSFGRKQRMAILRNLLRDNMLNYQSDYYIIIDADMLGGFSYEGVMNSFSYSWDVCAANSIIYKDRKYYYDSWAWRDIGHPDAHLDEEINPREFFRGDPPIDVISAFGGFGIYKKDVFCSPKYRYNDTDCDHVTINTPIFNDGAKIVVNPSMITLFNKTRYIV